MALIEKLTAIANAIRSKTGSTDPLSLDDMPTAIEGIKGGGGGSTEPYIEETYDSEGYLVDANMVGHTKVRGSLFRSCTRLAQISFPSDLNSIDNYAFYGCTSLALTSLPSSITKIYAYAFYNCPNLALTSLPSGLTSITSYSFYACTHLALTSLPSSITSISKNAFYRCISLKSITFEGTPTSIDSMAFYSCSYITTINVPWSEGEVANAPWGATKATINYNYTG